MATVLIPIPKTDFDPTEAAVPWKILRAAGHSTVFATPDGTPAQAHKLMLTGDFQIASHGGSKWSPGIFRIAAGF